MAATWGHYGKLKVSSTYNGSPTEVAGLKSCTLNNSRDLLDTTALSDSTFKKRLATLEDWSLDFSGQFVDEAPQGLVRSLMRAGTQIWFTLVLNSAGTLGYKAATDGGGGFTSDFSISFGNTDEIMFKGSIKGNQALELLGTPES